jgi:hypothetical protein
MKVNRAAVFLFFLFLMTQATIIGLWLPLSTSDRFSLSDFRRWCVASGSPKCELAHHEDGR